MSMYNRFASDVSDDLFDSVYSDLYCLAEKQQKEIYIKESNNGKKKRFVLYAGEHQETLNKWCRNKLSLGDALDYIKIFKVT